MKKVFYLILLGCCMASSMVAMSQQVCVLNGQIVDVQDETVPYATIGVYDDDKVVSRKAADMNGCFSIELKQGNEYTLEVTSVGFAPYKSTLQLPNTTTHNMGKIVMKASTELQEVVVVTQKPIIRSDAEKITYDVTADPESDTKTLLDMMRKVPMVTVDGEENVQLNGSSDFKVLINGKESAMVKNNLKEVLRAMPASGVQDIQVITNPSSRYDAEGAGGVINIITVRSEVNDMSGITGTITANGEMLNGQVGGNAYITMQHKKFTASLNYFGSSFKQNQYSNMLSYNYNNPDMYRTEVNTGMFGDMKVGGQFHMLTFESSYELDSLNLFTLGLSGNLGNFGGSGKGLNRTYTQDNRLVVNYIDYLMQSAYWGALSASFDYQHTFDRPLHTLTTSYRYEYNPDGSSYSDSIAFDSETLNAPMDGQMNENIAHSQEHTVQIDYNNPLTSEHSIEAGAKYIARLNHSNDDYMMLLNGKWQSVGMAQNFDYTQQIASLYAGYAYTRTNWGFRVGGRYEMTFIDASFLSAGEQVDYGKPYGNFVPYASINYNISPMESLRFSYTQRINRPGITYLSPYEQWTTPTSVQCGNPDLQPEVTHAFTAAYSIFKGVFNLNMQWFAKISNNSISPLVSIDAETDVKRSTYGNIATEQVYGVSAYISGQPSPKFSYYINLQPAYKTFSAPDLKMSEARWGGSLFGGINWSAWKNGSITVDFGGGLPDGHMQLESELMWYYYGMSVTHRFFDDKFKVTLSANNIFNKYNRYRVHTVGDGFESITEGGSRSQRLNLSLSYTFGNLKATVKKAHRGIVNDDVVGGASEGRGSQSGM